MKNRDERVIRAGELAVKFLPALETLSLRSKPPSSRIVQATKRLKKAVEAARVAGQCQDHAKKILGAPGKSIRAAKVNLLRQHLDPIVADGLAMLTGLPGIKQSLRLPRIKDAPEKLLEAAERVRRVAEGHAQEFITQYEYGEDFLEQLDAAVQDLKTAVSADPGRARANYSRATSEVTDEIAAVRRAIDALHKRVVAEYLGDETTLELWRNSRRVPAIRGRPTKRRAANKLARRAAAEQLERQEQTPSARDSR